MNVYEVWCEDSYGHVLDSTHHELKTARSRCDELDALCAFGDGRSWIEKKIVDSKQFS